MKQKYHHYSFVLYVTIFIVHSTTLLCLHSHLGIQHKTISDPFFYIQRKQTPVEKWFPYAVQTVSIVT